MDFEASVRTYSVKQVLMRCEGNMEDIRRCLRDIGPKLDVNLLKMLLTASAKEIAKAESRVQSFGCLKNEIAAGMFLGPAT